MKKLLLAVLTGAAAISLVACGKKTTKGTTKKATGATTVVTTQKKEKLVIGTNAAFPPFEFKDADGNITGFDMELIKAYGEYVNKDIEIKDMEFDAALTSAATGKIDIAIAGITKNEKREQTLSFSDGYYNSNQVVICKTGSDLSTLTAEEDILSALEGKKIGCQRATTGQFYIEGDADWGFDGIEGAQCKPYDNGGLAIKDLNDGKIDAVILDEAPAKNIVAKSYSSTLTILSTALTQEEYAIAVKKGNTELVNSLNAFIKTIKENGEYNKLLEKYFG